MKEKSIDNTIREYHILVERGQPPPLLHIKTTDLDAFVEWNKDIEFMYKGPQYKITRTVNQYEVKNES